MKRFVFFSCFASNLSLFCFLFRLLSSVFFQIVSNLCSSQVVVVSNLFLFSGLFFLIQLQGVPPLFMDEDDMNPLLEKDEQYLV